MLYELNKKSINWFIFIQVNKNSAKANIICRFSQSYFLGPFLGSFIIDVIPFLVTAGLEISNRAYGNTVSNLLFIFRTEKKEEPQLIFQ